MRSLFASGLILTALCSVAAADDTTSNIPKDFTVGIGIGWYVGAGADLFEPNAMSVQVRMPSGITIEPRMELSRTTFAVERTFDDTDFTDETEGKATQYDVGVQVGIPLVQRRSAELRLDVIAMGSRRRLASEDDTSTAQLERFAMLGGGATIEWWLKDNLSLSGSFSNALVTWDKRTEDRSYMERTDSYLSLAAKLEPNVAVFLHLYY